jgi:hypothetical protein
MATLVGTRILSCVDYHYIVTSGGRIVKCNNNTTRCCKHSTTLNITLPPEVAFMNDNKSCCGVLLLSVVVVGVSKRLSDRRWMIY